MDIDDPSSYVTDRLDVLARMDRALELFDCDDKRPFVFGDTEMAQAWLIHAGVYDELARARAWVQADRAAAADTDDPELGEWARPWNTTSDGRVGAAPEERTVGASRVDIGLAAWQPRTGDPGRRR